MQLKQKDIQTKLESQFKKKALPHMHISQSKPITIHGKNYRVVGQYTFKSPMLTYFDVYDDSGVRANEKNGLTVFTYIASLQIAEQLSQNKYIKNYEDMVLETDIPATVSQVLQTSEYKDVLTLFQDYPAITDAWDVLHSAMKQVSESASWDVDNLQPFYQAWHVFWVAYSKRLKSLFRLRDLIVQHKLLDAIKGTNLESIYEEAEFMYQLFAGTIPIQKPIISEIDDLLMLNYELGRVKQPGLEASIITRFELFSNKLFKVIFRLLLWILLPVALILVLLGIESSRFLFVSMAFAFFSYYVYMVDANGMKANIASRSKDHRQKLLPEQPIIQTTYNERFSQYKAEQEQQQIVRSFDSFTTILVRPGRWLLGIGIVITILGWALFNVDTDSSKYSTGYFIVGSALIILGIFLPYWSITKRTFNLQHDALIIGKREHRPEMIHYIDVKRKGKIIKVLTTHVQQPMIFKVDKADQGEVYTNIKHWCRLHDVKFGRH